MEKQIEELFRSYSGKTLLNVEPLPVSGSARRYYRVYTGDRTYVAVYHENLRENQLFVDFTRHFKQCGLHVPEVYHVSDDGCSYLQDDLGRDMLLDVVKREREGAFLCDHTMLLYRKALSELLRFQLIGGEGLDYTNCLPRPVFDERCIRWDLNYFKYCFLKLAAVEVDEERLENDFDQLVMTLMTARTDSFMFRDFQSRNIMVVDDEVYFIDYQGGRQGALHYDVASLLYDAIVELPEEQKEELLSFYIKELAVYRREEAETFREKYYHFVLIRLLQAMGAFGLRGLHEGKTHFVDSIVPGLQGIIGLFESGKLNEEYAEIQRTIRMAFKKYFVPLRAESNE
ncbi:aminoglycoside phosphotransferase family protein [Odoribacter sp. AF15-53]|uniref:aminoglycoside phosphotransferase family protein n=1 Tax=Odoribacter sp. AF15-53 TaxID=2292236 RepID=UPI000E5193D8|nr:phosphotransferase [Odoribacter sp. AF15-53]RHR73192.1 aminoglycoside phosphotransferase [Odoribacter sp. AF15-53]